MSARIAIAIAGALAACGPSGDPLAIRYRLSHGPENECRQPLPDGSGGDLAANCTEIPMTCEAVMMLRIINPDPGQPERYVDECIPIPLDDGRPETLCAINSIAFPEGRMPTDRVEVQIAIYARDELDETPPPMPGMRGMPICPADVEFTATHFASIENDKHPALSGRGFADGYDQEVIIELGCQDLGQIDNAVCREEVDIDISATVIDIETQLSVSPGTASNLFVFAGEPYLSDPEWIIDSSSTTLLELQGGPVPSWLGGDIKVGDDREMMEIPFSATACIQVLEDLPGRTASLACYEPTQPLPDALDLGGVLVRKPTLDAVLGALGLTEFPSDCATGACGLVLGIVVDEVGQAVPGVVVRDSTTPMPTEVKYLSEDRTTTAGITATTTAGMFLSETAQFFTPEGPNQWTVTTTPSGPTQVVQLNTPVGGIVSNRLTVLVFRVQTIE